jgi:hypothetical protein
MDVNKHERQTNITLRHKSKDHHYTQTQIKGPLLHSDTNQRTNITLGHKSKDQHYTRTQIKGPTLHSDTNQRNGAFSVVLHFTVKTESSKMRITHTLE